MMNFEERELALERMGQSIASFYSSAVGIGNHPFIEFAGVMSAYVKSCKKAHSEGIDFSECNLHSGSSLPMEGFEIDYLNEKLNCIFSGRITATELPTAM